MAGEGLITVTVNLDKRSYPILIGHNTLGVFGKIYAEQGLGRVVAIVTNSKVASLYLKSVQQSLEEVGTRVVVTMMPDGEIYKTLETARVLYGDLIRGGVDREACIVALGGGVVSDTAGFVAATYLRGIDYVSVPTTLEAQVDASVGGKTAVDHPLGKNLIGAFHQPKMVYIDTNTLLTLPRREIVAGMAEVVKHGLIGDPDLISFLECNLETIISLDLASESLDWLIAQNCRIKSGIVAADETEKGLREILNYGHTIGHAIEVMTDYQAYKHGEAVCLGMLAAGKIALDKGFWNKCDFERQNRLLRRLGIPKIVAELSVNGLLEKMRNDKKVRNGVIRFLLLKRIGKVVSCDGVTHHEIRLGIQYMLDFLSGSILVDE